MIKRRFYRQDRGDKDEGSSSDSSSSSSDSDRRAPTTVDSDSDAETQHPQPQPADSDVEDDDGLRQLKPKLPSSSDSDSEIDAAESAGFPTNDDDSETEKDGEPLDNIPASRKGDGRRAETLAEDDPVDDIPICILKSKSVFKCRLCPKIVCLNKETLNTHLQSKRHARSEKLLKDGKLKLILDSDGEEEVVSEDDCETHAERHARIIALAQMAQSNPKKKSTGRQRQRERLKRKKEMNISNTSEKPNSGQLKENRAQRRRKNIG